MVKTGLLKLLTPIYVEPKKDLKFNPIHFIIHDWKFILAFYTSNLQKIHKTICYHITVQKTLQAIKGAVEQISIDNFTPTQKQNTN